MALLDGRDMAGFVMDITPPKWIQTGETGPLAGWYYRPVPKLSSAGEITATKTEMSVACEMDLFSGLTP